MTSQFSNACYQKSFQTHAFYRANSYGAKKIYENKQVSEKLLFYETSFSGIFFFIESNFKMQYFKSMIILKEK